jgi:hypothetical protein
LEVRQSTNWVEGRANDHTIITPSSHHNHLIGHLIGHLIEHRIDGRSDVGSGSRSLGDDASFRLWLGG